MFSYEMAKVAYRTSVDLRHYESIIADSVQKLLPNAKVEVLQQEYIINVPYAKLDSGVVRAIGMEIALYEEFLPYIAEYRNKLGKIISRQLFRKKR